LIVLLGAVALHAQSSPRDNSLPQQTGSGIIRGRVTAADGGEALRNARVMITGPTSAPRVFTDGDGRFVFANLAFGRYTLLVRKAGYPQTRLGAHGAADPPMWIDVSTQSPAVSITIRMPRSAAISGRIVDDLGDPIELAQVSAERIVRTDGRLGTVTMAATTTDDLGEYRLGALPEGRYVVSARRTADGMVRFTVVNGRMVAERPDWAPSRGYYPGVTTLGAAQSVEVRAGEERSSVDFAIVRHKQPPATLTLSFLDPRGDPMLAAANLANLDDPIGGTVFDANGISDRVTQRLDPGNWLLVARGVYAPGVAAVPITIGSSDVSMSVQLRRGGRISGRVVTDGGPPLTAPIDIEARPLDPTLARMSGPQAIAHVRAGDAFTLTGLIGTRELRIRSAPHGWMAKAILAGGRDVMDVPIEFKGDEDLTGIVVVLTHGLGELSGTAGDASVLIFPENPTRYRDLRRLARWVRPDQTGRFVVDDLLPGSYFVAATRDVDDAQWANADYLERFRGRATRVAIEAGERKSIALTADSVQ
jgi:carboxypeptidase family protein